MEKKKIKVLRPRYTSLKNGDVVDVTTSVAREAQLGIIELQEIQQKTEVKKDDNV